MDNDLEWPQLDVHKKFLDLQLWLEDASPEAAVLLALRTGLRVLPYVVAEPSATGYDAKDRRQIIWAFRFAAFGRLLTMRPQLQLDPLDKAFSEISPRRKSTAGIAIESAFSVCRALNNTKRGSLDAKILALKAGDAVRTAWLPALKSSNLFWKAIAADIEWLEKLANPQDLLSFPLWIDRSGPIGTPESYASKWTSMRDALSRDDANWKIWTDWYEDRLVGAPVNEDEIEYFKITLIPGAMAQGNDSSDKGRKIWGVAINENLKLLKNDPRKANRVAAKYIADFLTRRRFTGKSAMLLARKSFTNFNTTSYAIKSSSWKKEKVVTTRLQDLEIWLKKASPEAATIIASRLTLRNLPYVVGESDKRCYDAKERREIIWAFRYAAFGRLVTIYPKANLNALDNAFNTVSSSRTSIIRAAIWEAYAACSSLDNAARGDFYADIPASRAHYAAKIALGAESQDSILWTAVASDIERIEKCANPLDLLLYPMWLDRSGAAAIPALNLFRWNSMRAALEREDASWKVWTDWYQARLDGAPSDNDETEFFRIFLIPDAAAKANDNSDQGRRVWHQAVDENLKLFKNDARKANRVAAKCLAEIKAAENP